MVNTREQAISYVLEDACVEYDYLDALRPERNVESVETEEPNVKPVDKQAEEAKDRSSDEDDQKPSSAILKEFEANYPGSDMANPIGKSDLLHSATISSSYLLQLTN